jgi:hypothetical protein
MGLFISLLLFANHIDRDHGTADTIDCTLAGIAIAGVSGSDASDSLENFGMTRIRPLHALPKTCVVAIRLARKHCKSGASIEFIHLRTWALVPATAQWSN